jgi:hypothetical protein
VIKDGKSYFKYFISKTLLQQGALAAQRLRGGVETHFQ